MRIIMLASSFPPLYSGQGYFLLRLAKGLVKKGHSVTILAQRAPGTPQERTVDGVKVVRFFFPRRIEGQGSRNVLRQVPLAVKILFYLLFNGYKFDIYHSGAPIRLSSIVFRISAKIYGKKYICESSLYGSDDPITLKNDKSRLGAVAFRVFLSADAFVSLSTLITDTFEAAGVDKGKVFQIPHMVDIDIFRPAGEIEKKDARAALGLPPDKTILISVGGVIKRKRFDILISAVKIIKERYPDVLLMIVGPYIGLDEAYEELSERIKSEGLSQHVLFTGLVENIDNYLRASDIFVFSSKAEGFSSAIVEAMGSALPCVIPNLYGSKDKDVFTEGGSGIVIDTDDPKDYADAVIRLISDKELRERIGKAARRSVEKDFSSDVIVGKYIDMFEKVMLR